MKQGLLFLIVISLLLLQSCKKDKGLHCPTPTVSHNLKVNFTNTTIPIGEADSVKVELTNEATQVKEEKKLVKEDKAFSLDISYLASGTYTAKFAVYTPNNLTNNSVRFYTIENKFTKTAGDTKVAITGPNGLLSDVWKGWVQFRHTEAHLTIAVDAENPFFTLKVNDRNKWDYIYIDRIVARQINNGEEVVESGAWECIDNCFNQDGIISNSTEFAPFSDRVRGKTWDSGEVMVLLMNQTTGAEVIFFSNYRK